jgi:hypothetical protein
MTDGVKEIESKADNVGCLTSPSATKDGQENRREERHKLSESGGRRINSSMDSRERIDKALRS